MRSQQHPSHPPASTRQDTPISVSHRSPTQTFPSVPRSNTRSVADISGDRAQLPLKIGRGWQYVNLDLERIVRLAFGTNYLTTSQVTLRASARISKVYFQSENFSDFELPAHLRAIPD